MGAHRLALVLNEIGRRSYLEKEGML